MAHKSVYDRLTEDLCEELRLMRESAVITQVEMAEQLGRSQRSVSHIELGTTRLDLIQLMDWCDVCGQDIVSLTRRMLRHAEERGRRRKGRAT